MKNAKYDRAIQQAIVSQKSDEPTIELKAYASAGQDLARVIIDVTHTPASRANPSVVMDAIGKKLEGRFQAVAGSFVTVDKGAYTDRIMGIVGRVRQVVAIDDQSIKGFKAVSSNMFMDEEKEMWALKRTSAGNILIKTFAEDDLSLLNLLEATASSGYRSTTDYAKLSAMCGALAKKVKGGDYVTFIDMNNRAVEGFVVATTDEGEALVLPPDSEDGEVVNLEAITDIHDQDEFPEPELTSEEAVDQEVAVASGKVDVPYMIAYYKKIYSMDPKFFEEFSKRIREHAFA